MAAPARPPAVSQYRDPPPPGTPTQAPPGSAEKVAVLAARLEAGAGLWHPLDADAMHRARLGQRGRRLPPRAVAS